MLATDEFILRYETYTDADLHAIYEHLDDYSPGAQDAFKIVIQKKGGLEKWLGQIHETQAYAAETMRIGREAAGMAMKNVDVDFIRTIVSSKILPPEEVDKVITQAFGQAARHKEDRKIKPRTIIGGVLGVIVAGIIGGIGWGLKEVYAPDIYLKIQLLLVAGLILLSYGIIKAFTRQSKGNVVVLIATALSVILSILLGLLISDLAPLLNLPGWSK
jgi:hypothetical protein